MASDASFVPVVALAGNPNAGKSTIFNALTGARQHVGNWPGKTVDVKVYPGAGHAFANVNNPWGGYRKEAAEDAWARTTAFLAKHLKK